MIRTNNVSYYDLPSFMHLIKFFEGKQLETMKQSSEHVNCITSDDSMKDLEVSESAMSESFSDSSSPGAEEQRERGSNCSPYPPQVLFTDLLMNKPRKPLAIENFILFDTNQHDSLFYQSEGNRVFFAPLPIKDKSNGPCLALFCKKLITDEKNHANNRLIGFDVFIFTYTVIFKIFLKFWILIICILGLVEKFLSDQNKMVIRCSRKIF